MKISTHKWAKVDARELAALTYAAKRVETGKTGDEAIEQVVNWLQEELTEFSRVAVLARSGGQLVGWLLLVVRQSTMVEANPWFLGGHPIVAPGSDAQEVGSQLLQEAKRWAAKERFGRLTLATPMVTDDQINQAYGTWYETHGFHVSLKYVEMICHLAELEVAGVTLPAGLKVRRIRETDEDELYSCYHDAFQAGDARFFFDQDEGQRRAFFDTLGFSDAVEEQASLALIQDGRIIGFTYVLPYGEGNRHISCMCVHPDYQGRRLGRALLYLVMDRVARQGQKTLTLGTETEMRAFNLYASHGFKVTEGSIVYAWDRVT